MQSHLCCVLLLAFHSTARAGSIYDLEANDLESGLPVPMKFYEGKVMLIINLASQCGYTDQSYTALNELHKSYESKGLAILGFPCNRA